MPHRVRERISPHLPLHVSLRVLPSIGNLRRRALRRRLRASLSAGSERFGFRLVHFSVQRSELQLVCESDDSRALARGLQGLAIRLAKAINRTLSRNGRVFADRYRARVLRSREQVRRALAYLWSHSPLRLEDQPETTTAPARCRWLLPERKITGPP